MITETVQLIVRVGPSSQWSASNPVLALGEPGWDSTLKKMKVGDGVTAWNSLEFQASGGGAWGGITGTLSDQTDLQDALDLKADLADIPIALSELSEDSTHRVVTDAEKSTWDAKEPAITKSSGILSWAGSAWAWLTAIAASIITQDSTHRMHTDAQAATWDGKQDALGFTAVPNTRTVAGKALSADISLVKADVGLANVDNTSDANKPVSTATQTALNAKEPTIAPGTTSQYWRGDKTWQTLPTGAGWVVAGAFSPVLTLTADTKLPDTTVTGPINFTISGTPAVFKETYVRLTADGVNTPTFTGFAQWPGSPDYDNTNGAVNQISFFNDGTTSYYAITPNTLTAFDPDSKQDLLVSATNIKTVNSTTLLGSGDLSVQATLVSGTNIKTINSQSILGSGDLVVSGGGVDLTTTLEILDHLIYGTNGWGPLSITYTTNSGGQCGPVTVAGCYGVQSAACGSTATIGALGRYLGSAVVFNIAATRRLVLRSRVSSAANFDGTNTGALYWGYYNASGTNAPRDGIFFRQTDGGNLFAVTMDDLIETATDLGFAPVLSTWYNFEVRINSGGTSVGFYIDGVLVATHTTNITTGLTRTTTMGWMSIKTAAHAVSVAIQADLAYQKVVYDSALF